MVCGHTTKDRLEERMDRLLTATHHTSGPKRQESPIRTLNSQQTTTYRKRPLFYWQGHDRKHDHRRETKHPRPIPATRQIILGTRIPEVTQTYNMGSRHQTASGSPQHFTRTSPTSHAGGNRGGKEIRRRAFAAKHHPTIVESLRSQLLLCQEERW